MSTYCFSATGQEYPAIVEFAPFQKTAKKRSKKKDAKCGTITEGKDIYWYLKETYIICPTAIKEISFNEDIF